MIIGTIKENQDEEKRISITPEIAKKYISSGFQVLLEKGTASHLGISDSDFEKEGCKIDTKSNVLNNSDILLQLNLPDEQSTENLKENKILIGSFNSTFNKDRIANISKKKNIGFFARTAAENNQSTINGHTVFASKPRRL